MSAIICSTGSEEDTPDKQKLTEVIYQKLNMTISGLSGLNRSPRKYIKEQFYAMLYITSKPWELSFPPLLFFLEKFVHIWKYKATL